MRYVISDIHGEYDLFVKLLDRIGFSSRDELYVCGDIIEKGRDSIKLARLIFSMPNAYVIMGNHEHAFIQYYRFLTLSALGKKFDLDDTSVVGLIATLANSIATMESADRMNRKGRVLNLAFAVSAAFVFGDHLAFTLSYNDEHIIPVIVGKLVAGITALVLASILYKKTNK